MMPMDYGRNKKIHGFSKKSHNCNPCAQHSNTYQRGLKLKHERGNPSKPPLMPPPPCGGRECRQQNLWAITKITTYSSGDLFRVLLGAHRRVSRLPAAAAAGSQDTSSKPPRFFRRRRRFGAFLHAKKGSHLPDGSLFVCCVSSDAAGSCRRCGRPPAR